jgi:hypothetical protein
MPPSSMRIAMNPADLKSFLTSNFTTNLPNYRLASASLLNLLLTGRYGRCAETEVTKLTQDADFQVRPR